MRIRVGEYGLSAEAVGIILAEATKSNKKMTLEDFGIILAKMDELGGKWDIDEDEVFKVETNGKVSSYNEIYFDGTFSHFEIEIVGSGDEKITDEVEEKLF